MPDTRTLTITLSQEAADAVKAKIASGEFASESEFIQTAIQEVSARDRGLDHWIRTEGMRRCAAMDADPSRALSHEEFWAGLEEDETVTLPKAG